MTNISSANSGAGDAVVSLLRSSSQDQSTPSRSAPPKQDSASRNPIDTVDLSDRAQTILARAKIEKVAADKLALQVQSAKSSGRAAGANTASADSFELGGNSSDGSASTPGTGSGNFDQISGYLDRLIDDHRAPDGTVSSFTKTVNDFFTVPSTPEELSAWYKNQEEAAAQSAAAEPDPALKAKAEAYLDAVRNHQVTLVSADDIPELNFHNTWTLQGAEGGSSINFTSTYNHNASIFKDPATTYFVDGNGSVVVWKHAADGAAASSS
ncbi:hypothetical protein IVA88_09125 [Bradyrhizobium sp. 149]|uniref:hypothetical protein n=1 Tax=Bradyrhizobium sp. 149 TaxID=2782624 RepID=UPI001FF91D3C|nr:hypothetical protein [Bradyrhizobium sp. 149]MCK1651593.1 hypothetical protein [Bradyrhizobium sp. 149]